MNLLRWKTYYHPQLVAADSRRVSANWWEWSVLRNLASIVALIAMISRGVARLPSDQVCHDLTSRTPGARLKVLRLTTLQGAYELLSQIWLRLIGEQVLHDINRSCSVQRLHYICKWYGTYWLRLIRYTEPYGALCRARPNDYTYDEHNALIALLFFGFMQAIAPVCIANLCAPCTWCFLTVALNYTEPNWRSRCSNFYNFTVCKAGPVIHAGVACYTVLYNFERWITQLVCRWRVQPTVWINANCRTLWASTSWTHIAVIGNPVTTSVWVSAFHLSSH